MNTINRATHREENGRVSINQGWTPSGVINRLAAYEDTGLEPEEIEDALSRFSELLCYLTNNHMSKTNYTMGAMLSEIEDVRQEACERYCDLKQAEQEGRLVVLPCKVGDTVYVFYAGRRNCKWPCNMKKGKIYEVIVSGMRLHDWSDDWSVLLFFDTKEMSGDYEFSFTEFGKTIFSTRSKAEAAMKGA